MGGPGAARRGRVRGATWTAEKRLRFWAESDGGTTTSKSQRCPKTGVSPGGGASRPRAPESSSRVCVHSHYAADDDMRAWTVFCNTHCAWSVSDLTPIVAALEIDSKPFFGPVRRADGVFQLYVELPYHHYLEIDSLTFKGTVGTPSAQAWADVV